MKRVLSALIVVLAVQVSWGSALGLPAGRTTTTTNTNLPGIIDNKPLRFHVFGADVLPVEPTTSPNVIGGLSGIGATSASLTAAVARLYYASIGDHMGNSASGFCATVGGGFYNDAIGNYATVGGGSQNEASGNYATVGGGSFNEASSSATVGGGVRNKASFYATVGGGRDNNASGDWATVGGGRENRTSSFLFTGDYATVGGGRDNNASGDYATVGGGRDNRTYRFISFSGIPFYITGEYATVGGGDDNSASGDWATVGGGHYNEASANYATVGGGAANDAIGDYATVGGGWYNTANGIYATVGGGHYNEASGYRATVGGGHYNTASSDWATVGGGFHNDASDDYATVPGGASNSATGSYSFAAGRRAKAHDQGAFVWADSNDLDFDSTADNEFSVRCTGGARFVTQIDTSGNPAKWAYLDPATALWTVESLSDRNLKANLVSVDGYGILERLASIPIKTWSYKGQYPSIRHMGPMAQDFHEAFGLGRDEKSINTADADGVALAAIQGLYELVREKDAQIADLKARVEALEALVSSSAQEQ
jgi:hypothetical protein